MRPNSIVMFERLFLASLAVGVLAFVIGFDQVMAALARDPTFRRAGLGSGFVIGLTSVGYAVYLLLWYLIAHKAVRAAKWILIVFTAIGVVFALPALRGAWDLTLLLNVAVYVLEVTALVYLFRPDALAWLKGEGVADPVADPTLD